ETKIGGYFENSQQLAHRVASIIGEDDFILLKGSPRSSDFKFVKDDILKIVGGQNKNQTYKYTHPFASGVGAATFDIETKEKIGWYGNQDAIQNEGIGNVLLISHI